MSSPMVAAAAALTVPGGVLLGLAGCCALVNWWAVWVGNRKAEWVAKPATLTLLVAVAAVLTPADSGVRWWMLAGLVCSLAGDVFLMLPREQFVAGLASFLLGHIAYIVALTLQHESWGLTLVGIAAVVAALALVGWRILGAVRRGDDAAFAAPVVVYMAVISVMVIAAFGTAGAVAIIGAVLFYVSDATLAWNKFVRPFRAGRLAVMTTYHLGQVGLVLSLVHGG